MAQTFLIQCCNPRLHPVEFSNGQTGGVAAAYAIINKVEQS